MYFKLPRFEIYGYFITWILGVSYSVYHIYLLGNDFKYSTFYSFVPGWSFLKQRKDESDHEWAAWLWLIQQILPWIAVEIIVAEFIRWWKPKLLSLWYFMLSTLFMIHFLGLAFTALMILQPCIVYAFAQFKSRAVVWTVSMTLLVVFCSSEVGDDWIDVSYDIRYLVVISMAWNYLRTISFCCENMSNPSDSGSLLCLLGYCMYLPTLFFGPLILYEPFKTGISKPFSWTLERFISILLNLFRYVGWAFIAELILHYFYFGAMQAQPHYVENMEAWALYGLGYCMGQFFMLKYTVIYGLSGMFARIEQIDAPHHPKCIGRIHLYSDMWRYFDQGLYFFLARYIYVPCLGSRNPSLLRKFSASFICFVFVYIWHSTFLHILVWSTLNFLGVTVEGICKTVGSSPDYKNWEEKHMSKANSRRFKALISVPLFIMSAMSNFYFFSGYAVGNIYFYRLFSGSLLSTATLLLFCYCCCQVSIEVSCWEGRRSKGSKKLD